MTAIAIREATLSDAADLVRLYQQIDHESPPELSRVEAFLNAQEHQSHSTIFVALDGDKMVGTYQLFILSMLNHNMSHMAVVEAVVVDADERSRGIGETMMTHAKEQAWESNCYKLTLSSNLKRQRAHDFYERIGFEKHGHSFLVKPRLAE